MIMATADAKAKCMKALEELGGTALVYEIASKTGLTEDEVREAMAELKDWGVELVDDTG